MKIVKQSFEILPNLDDPIKQIAAAARLCYKSEDKAQEDERPFLTRIHKHEPVFEMAVVSLILHGPDESIVTSLKESKYMHVSYLDSEMYLVTGSIRAWREWIIASDDEIVYDTWYALNQYNEFLFPEFSYIPDVDGPSLADIEVVDPMTMKLTDEQYKKHVHVAVKFITNRAVSHEMVRHRPCSFLQESQRYCSYGSEKFGKEVVFIDPRPAFDIFKDDDHFFMWKQTCEDAEAAYLDFLINGASAQAARTVLPNSCKTEIIVYCTLHEWEHIFNRRTPGAAEPSMREQTIPLHEKFMDIFPGLFEHPQLSVG